MNLQKTTYINYTTKGWSNYSYDLKMFVSNLLSINWAERISASQAYDSAIFDSFKPKSNTIKNIIKYSKTKTNVFASKENVDYIKYLMTIATISDSVRSTVRRAKSMPLQYDLIKKLNK